MRRYVCYIGTEGQENPDKYFRRTKKEITDQGCFAADENSAIIFIKSEANSDIEIIGLP